MKTDENSSVQKSSAHDRGADLYDDQVKAYECYAQDVLFGLSYDTAFPGQRLLDLGIGTGLSALPFHKAGLEVYGVDGSAEMLRGCEAKGFAKRLVCHDLLELPLPFPDRFFHQVISCGVFHFLSDLQPVFQEVTRLALPGGIFAFTVASSEGEPGPVSGDRDLDYIEIPNSWGIPIFAHSPMYIASLLQKNQFRLLKRQKFLVPGGEGQERLFTAFISEVLPGERG